MQGEKEKQEIETLQINKEQGRPKYDFPSKQELIQEIKMMDADQKFIVLNLNKCHFDAKEEDVKNSFPSYQFHSVKNYRVGSFEVVFTDRKQAIQFIRNKEKKRILDRKFFIKMGRKKNEDRQGWVRLGPPLQRGPYRNDRPKRDRDQGWKNQRGDRQERGQDRRERRDQKRQDRREQRRQDRREQRRQDRREQRRQDRRDYRRDDKRDVRREDRRQQKREYRYQERAPRQDKRQK